MAQGYLIFHLNLAFSSIKTEARPEVIRKCYWPLLELAESTGIPVGIELTGWTLQQIELLDPSWVDRFRQLLKSKQCELIGSGWSQIIGPLVPYEVNCWNQKLGKDAYQQTLGVTPKLALVNEMAFSTGMVDVYAEAGYQGIIMDRDNVRLALGIEAQPITAVPTHAVGLDGTALPVVWSDSILFQKLQHYVHGDITVNDYQRYLFKRVAQGEELLPIYCNDAEVFDYRPGRFKEERAANSEGEWNRLKRLLDVLAEQEGVTWCSPSEALQKIERSAVRYDALLSTVAQPLPVKKQAKYNIARWAVTGRNDIWINTICHRLHRSLLPAADALASTADWRALCELWASDLRTHITQDRWQQACTKLTALALAKKVPLDYGSQSAEVIGKITARSDSFAVTRDAENILLTVNTSAVRLVLNLRRGLNIQSLAYRSHDFVPAIGTLQHGFFSSIALGADYYSGGVIVELPAEHARVTDLERSEPEIFETAEKLYLKVQIETSYGPIIKLISVDREGERVSLAYSFPGWKKMRGILRAGIVTLMPEAFDSQLTLTCVNGGQGVERFALDRACDHSAAVSSLVSCTAGFGATTGTIVIGDDKRKVSMTWDPSLSAVLPMLVHKQSGQQSLTRVVFSLGEIDDTSRPEGEMPILNLCLAPEPLAAITTTPSC